ncbi:hypothetical protein J4429_03560 [Candidatus Pacearchaeota archaeon]|nr:hypothetical protein [Candidatus Pacearchaeota archaeon]
MHLKRNNIKNFWPIPRKGTKFVAVPSHNQYEALPLVVVMRDILKLVRNNKELKKVIHEKQVLVNNKIIHDTNYPISLFDIINLPHINKHYKAIISKNKKMDFEEINNKEKTKVLKVICKKVIDSKNIQLNLMHGWNVISKEKVNTGDSVVINMEDKKIVKIIPLEKGRKVIVIKGKHTGNTGKIEEIIERGGKKLVKISSDDKKINVWVKNIILTE